MEALKPVRGIFPQVRANPRLALGCQQPSASEEASWQLKNTILALNPLEICRQQLLTTVHSVSIVSCSKTHQWDT
jgi:hypothetical protein